MDVTKRSDYACRLLRAAYEHNGEVVSVTEVSEANDIPYAFARSIQHDLVKNGLLKTIRGAKGGFTLACDPMQTTLLDVAHAVQGSLSIAPCSTFDIPCAFGEDCAFHQLWKGADAMLEAYLSSITLYELLEMQGQHPAIVYAQSGAGFDSMGLG